MEYPYVIAKGTFGEAVRISEDKITKTVNIFDNEKVTIYNIDKESTADFENSSLTEICILSSVKADFIPKLHNISIQEDKKFVIKQDYAGITLHEWARKNSFETRIKCLKKFLYQFSRMLYWMKKHHIIHMDIKPGNVCVSDEKLKLIDFGHCCPKYYNSVSYYGTEEYADPIYLNDDDNIPNHYCYDMFGVASTLYYVIFKKHPPKNKILCWDPIEEYEGNYIPLGMVELLNKMSNLSQGDRITAKNLYNHPIFDEDRCNFPLPKEEKEDEKETVEIPETIIRNMHTFCEDMNIEEAFGLSMYLLEKYLDDALYPLPIEIASETAVRLASILIIKQIDFSHHKEIIRMLQQINYAAFIPMSDWKIEMSEKNYKKLLDLYMKKDFRKLSEKKKLEILRMN